MTMHTNITARTFHSTIPALARYIDRIGAKEKNFRRYMVQQQLGAYYRELCLIKLANDGTITVTDPTYEPTADEKAEIKQAFESVTMPRSIEARPAAVQDLMVMLRAEHQREAVNADGDPLFFEFYNQRTGNLIMVQQRIDLPDGKKRYLPWSFWSDPSGITDWRNMEPDGDLPFWKPKRATDKSKIMVHEGAKAAQFVTNMCADEACNHPWIEELRQYEHWGMIGGALSPHRADYQELFERNPGLMVYVCDNDQPGKAAAPIVSKNYKRRMKRVNFDISWPEHWDMADPMPPGIKKRLKDCMRSCTWATEPVAVPDSKRVTYKINQPFADEWSVSTKQGVYVHNDLPRDLLDVDQFNTWVRPFSDVDDTAKLLRRKEECLAAGLRYNPSSPSGKAVGSENNNFVNTYMPTEVKPLEGDCTPWEDYLAHVFPNATDRTEVIRWCATLVCRPNIKMKYGMLLISETQGVGKSTLGEQILQWLVGEWNYSQPDAKAVCESSFNGWCAHKRLTVIHEVHEDYNSKGYERLKSVITEVSFDVNEKYQKAYRIDNWTHVIACSNNKRALKLGMEDRRWLVPRVAERKRSTQEWRAFHAWLDDGGLRKILWWLGRWLESNDPVRSGDEAPLTEAKKDVVRENYSRGEGLVADELERLNATDDDRPLIVFDVDLQTRISAQFYNGHPNDKLEKPATIRKVAKVAGWFVVDRPVQMRQGQWLRAGKTRALTNDPDLIDKSILELAGMVERGEALFVDVRPPTM